MSGWLAVTAIPASASTIATKVVLPAVSAAANEPFLMTATVEPNAAGGTVPITGTVTFSFNGSPIGACQNIPVSEVGGGSLNATAQCQITFDTTGMFTITASYSGDTNWSLSSLSTVENVLEPATVSASAPATAQLNQTVALSTTVSGSFGTPTGQVAFEDSHGTTLCTANLSGGHGSCNTAFSSGGAQTVKADYLGNSTYASSTGSNSFGSATVQVQAPPTTTTLTAQQVVLTSPSVPPGLTAYTMRFTATVAATGSPGAALSGSVSFTINGQPLAGPNCTNQAVSGNSPQSVTCATNDPEQFGGPVVAAYSGDPHFAGSSSAPLSPPFSPDTTSIGAVTALPPSVIVGQSMTLRAQVSAFVDQAQGPTGVVTFTSGSAVLCAAGVDSSFAAACQMSSLPAGTFAVTATYHDPAGGYAPSSSAPSTVIIAPTLYPVVGMATTPDGGGYWIARSDGAVSAFGDAVDFGSMAGQPLNQPVVGIAATPDGRGYWLVAGDGGIFSFGDAPFYGSTGSIRLNRPIVAMTSTPDGKGYYFVASDGGVFSYGDAVFQGSMGSTPLNQPVVGMAVDPASGGYWLVAADGGIFAFRAPFLGSTGSIALNKPIVGMEAAPDGSGYRFVASDGGVFCYGLPFEGSTGGLALVQPVVGMAASGPDGYWLAARDGGVFAFDAPFLGAATD